MNQLSKNRIQRKLLLTMVTILVLPAAMICCVYTFVELGSGKRETIAQLESVATLKRSAIETWLGSLATGLSYTLGNRPIRWHMSVLLTDDPSMDLFRESSRRKVDENLKRFQNQTKQFDNLFMINLKGVVVYGTKKEMEGKNHIKSEFFLKGIKGPFYTSPFHFDKPQKSVIIFSRPVLYQEKVVGVMAGAADLSHIRGIMMERSGLGKTGETYLIGKDMIPLTPLKFGRGEGKIKSLKARRAILEETQGSGIYSGYSGQKVVGVYLWLNKLNVLLMAEQFQREAFSSSFLALMLSGAIAFFAVVTAVIYGLFSIRKMITTPISKLVQTSSQVSRGKLDVRFPVTGDDEIGELAAAFNLMTENLANSVHSLREKNRELDTYRDRLELQVKERTQKLENTNQDLIRARDAAETANKAKSEFLANMSHEIRTPMNAILGFTEILKERESDPVSKRYLTTIQKSGKTLLNLINDILDLSRVEAGKLNLTSDTVNPRTLFREMQVLFHQKIKDKGLSMVIDIPESLPGALVLDETRLRQILLNLLGNAVKFTEKGGIFLKIQSRTGKKENTIELLCHVEDTGVGISPTNLKTIFDPFVQAGDAKKQPLEGTGLGLTITKRLAEMMNGTIEAAAREKGGSVFTLILRDVPVARDAWREREKLPIPDPGDIRFQPACVLIADDVDFNRELLKGYMSGLGLTFLEAQNGEETLYMLSRHNPDLLLLDMRMPVKNGYEVAREINETQEAGKIPIIAVTASAMKKDEEEISRLCSGYLKKPVSKTELIRALMEFLPHYHVFTPKPSPLVGEMFQKSLTPALCAFIKEELLPEFKTLEGATKMSAILEISQKIIDAGKSCNHDQLTTLGETLGEYCGNFDLKGVEDVHEVFKEAAKTCENLPERDASEG